MTNLILYIQLLKAPTHVVVEDDTVYVDARWYVKLRNRLHKSEWELDKHIHNVTHCTYFRYTFVRQNNKRSIHQWEWDEEQQRYK